MIRRLAIDLGTTNILIHVPGRGILIDEPAVAAINAADEKIVAFGEEARKMLGKTPDSIIAARPLKNGVIASFKITEAMLRYFINRVSGRLRLIRPDIMIAIPVGATSTERRAVTDACIAAGAKNAYLIKQPIAAALGANVPIAVPEGHLIIDIGGGTTEVAVISLGDVVASTSVRVGGNKMDSAIISFVRKKYSLIIGEQTAEAMKIKIGTVLPGKKDSTMELSGSNSVTGLPESVIVNSSDVAAALQDELQEIIGAVKAVLQKTPPELAADIMDKGMIMTGGGAELRGLDQLLTKVTGVSCQVAEEARLCVVKGTAIAVEHLDEYLRSILWAKR
ncbi:rod shape-determining protein [Candidatus Berkelbacteria bacterium RIFCSPLOWO2_01_FULL_50_28]|uniref:Cell shape-determining protein MreB n=1 Tax=Candidatus Berkelbacteria bacterium RIFCSPLOWO2_01_FULL_50_28 TaxID=1797471 RepID=A0A1F5EBV7_9BACT|nr:MAG: rod shape-determining protein [Candidatus Berkelbacteria bacterium RIFCSPHIGHO2_01_FULL_50_36]OGD62223.1 MAG: rod shape-determining protein [Candidatus Berkelbacteria bacterium RIFCSPHIGHO2_12_FULL_50_11]OGD64865.1 MAG: rod shape-determining protein [Candidatus Berkelbacteria bacterium RIFCSPLOWO2_01_FULL_50_28]